MASHRYVVEKIGSTGSVVSTQVGTTDLSKADFEEELGDGQSVILWEALAEGDTQPKPTPAKGTAAKRKS